MITVGTGIGGGIIYDGKIVNGSTYTAGEVGYLPMEDGQDWQSQASTTALLALYSQKTGEQGHTGRSFFAAVDQGDKLAQETLDIFLGRLAKGLLTLSYILNPEVLIVGGGILARSELILPRLESLMKQQVVDSRFLPKNLVAAVLGNEAGAIRRCSTFSQSGEKLCLKKMFSERICYNLCKYEAVFFEDKLADGWTVS